MSFSFLFNVPHFELSKKKNKEKLDNALSILHNLGVDNIVIGDLETIGYIRKSPYDFKIKISAVAGVKTKEQIKKLKDLGIKDVTLSQSLNRDTEKIKYFIDKGFNVTLISNQCCIQECPYVMEHYKLLSKGGPKTYKYTIHCLANKIVNKEEIIKSPWIRPEDITFYQDLGVTYFKISGRNFPLEWKLRVIKAYSEKHYEGNVLEILTGLIPNPASNFFQRKLARTIPLFLCYCGYNILRVILGLDYLPPFGYRDSNNFFNFMKRPIIYLNNRELDGFLGRIITSNKREKIYKEYAKKIKIPNNKALSRVMREICEGWGKEI
jgi:hypothetical protein